jgi:cytochrome P450
MAGAASTPNTSSRAAMPMSLRDRWMLVSQPRAFAARMRKRYGDLVSMRVRGERFVIVFSPEGARQVLSANPAGYDAFWKQGFTGLAGSGSIWVLGGESHRRERQVLSPAFHPRSFRGYGEIIQGVTHRHIDCWLPGRTVRAIDTTLAISLDVIMQLVFGVEEEEFTHDLRERLTAFWHHTHPLIVFFPVLQRGWFPLWRRYARSRARYLDWMTGYLPERRARGGGSNDVLEHLLAARYEDGSPMRDADICDELVTILLAGHETTATALAWALYEVGRHPAVLERLRGDLQALAGPDPDSVAKLPYLSAVCNETLRLHTLLPEVARLCSEPAEVLGHTLRPGDSVAVSVMAIHHDAGLYPEPDEFIPQRFIDRTYSAFEFLPFGGGHRRCLGAGLSDFEMRIALAEIVMHWDFEPAAVERDVRHDIAMGSRRGVPLRITARRESAASWMM